MDTSAARRTILARIRAALQRPALPTDAERAAAAAYLARHPAGPRPALPDDAVAGFAEQARRMSTTVDFVDRLDDAPAAAKRYLDGLGFGLGSGEPPRAAAWRTLSALPWDAAGLDVAFRKPGDADLIGITDCFCAVAETGTLVLLSGPDTCASTALLPETHIAIVYASRIVAGHEEAFALIRAERGELPRAVNLIAGPSRTGDIEQTIVLGAHGPYRVHALIVRDA